MKNKNVPVEPLRQEANLSPTAEERLAKIERYIDAYSIPPQAWLIKIDNKELEDIDGLSYRTHTRMRKQGILKNVSKTRKCLYCLLDLIISAAEGEFGKNSPMTLASKMRDLLRVKLDELKWAKPI